MPFRHLLLCGALVLLASCATSTKLSSTWAEPGTGPFAYQKILVVCPDDEKSRRLSAELRLSQRIPRSVAAYTVFDDGDERDMDKVKARIRALGFDAVVMMRVVAVDKSEVYVPPTVRTVGPGYGYGGMYGYWNTGWVEVYDPGYTSEKTVATIETSIFEVEGEKLVWVSRSSTMNPTDVYDAVDSIVDANADAMRKQGLLAR